MSTTALTSTSPDLAAATSAGKPPRLLSLDVFRGFTILGMILVNNPGKWGEQHQYGPLEHASWFGWTSTDLIFPFFLFIVGTSLAYSLRKFRDGAAIDPAVYWRIIRRTTLLIFLGWMPSLALKAFLYFHGDATTYDVSNLRLPGVLVRIALVYFIASMIVLHVGPRVQAAIGVVLLLGYWALLAFLPNPHDYQANLTPEGNLVRVVDLKLLGPDHMYTRTKEEKTDPEGLLSTLPAVVTSLIGYWVGLFIQRRGINWNTVGWLLAIGVLIAAIGQAWGYTAEGWTYAFPISKKLWTSSFVLLTGGLAMVALAVCLAIFDISGWRHLARPFEIVGINAIFVFVASGLVSMTLGRIKIEGIAAHDWMYQHWFMSWISDPKICSLAMALATVAFWWLVLAVMARLGWSIRV